MAEIQYKISYTAGGLFYREAVKATELFYQLKDWSLVRSEIVAHNLLKSRIHSTLIRTTRELIQRLQALTADQLTILVDGTRQEQNQILWLAVCKQYRFVREFAFEVVREKFLRLDLELSYQDFDIFFNNKAEWNDGLDHIKDSTRKKIRQVLFRIMTEAEIISAPNMILPMMISPRVGKAIGDDDTGYFSVFPIAEADMRKYKGL